MAEYSVIVRASVEKDIKGIPKKQTQRIITAIRALAKDPRPPQSKKLSGEEKYRLRCGVYRILYQIEDDRLVLCVVRVRHRKDAYRE
jgi:mRNA interferase RelE/StbE